jgi:hypothetical protein
MAKNVISYQQLKQNEARLNTELNRIQKKVEELLIEGFESEATKLNEIAIRLFDELSKLKNILRIVTYETM